VKKGNEGVWFLMEEIKIDTFFKIAYVEISAPINKQSGAYYQQS
jgi:hypothetical protein